MSVHAARRSLLVPLAMAGLAAAVPSPSTAQAHTAGEAQAPVWVWQSAYTADVIGVVDGVDPAAGRFLDNLDVSLSGDLDRQFGWTGVRVYFSLLANGGGEPNSIAGTLQGFDNIEVAAPGVRLYEAWVEQDLPGGGSVLAGLYDVNSEFYATGASDLLLSPPFGIGSELASTGPNGPAIFPSTSLAVRVRLGSPDATYVQLAAVNARAGTIGDDGGVDTTLDEGILYLAEAGWSGPLRLAAGVWAYGEGQEDIRALTPLGDPIASDARGAYLLAERTLLETPDGPSLHSFARIGISDGDTTDFRGGWQAGLRLDAPFRSRPDSALSFGVHQGLLSDKARANFRDSGIAPASAESGLELTYADRWGPVTVQPDLQWIHNPGGDRSRDAILIAGLRVILTLK